MRSSLDLRRWLPGLAESRASEVAPAGGSRVADIGAHLAGVYRLAGRLTGGG